MSAIVSNISHLGEPTMQVVNVTPETARKWLGRNAGNRPLKTSHVGRLAAAIKGGKWKLTGDPIRFSDTGKLIDGQHRLQAIVDAELPVQCVVMRGLNDDIFDVIDSGSTRSKADAVFIKYQLSVAKSGLLSSTANLAYQYASGFVSFKNKVATAELLGFIDANPDLVDAVNYVYDTTPHENPVPKSIAAAFYFFARRKGQALADAFILRFMVGAVDGANDNLLYLRNFCFNARAARRPTQTGEIFGRLVLVWNSERRGKPIKHQTNIRVRTEDAYPRFI